MSLTPALAGADTRHHPARSAMIVGVLAVCAWAIGRSTGFPAPVLAAVAGMGLGLAGLSGQMAPGLVLWAKPGLKIGVALLGAQIAWAELAALGLPVALASGGVVMASLGAGTLIGTLAGLPLVEALIAASAVSICGASAAMAAASALPETDNSRRTTALVVVGVNLLSTIAMVAYPVLATALGFSPRQIGVFLGLSIHDVAQVVAAGSSVSPVTEASAALAKLSRILWLGPVIVTIALTMRGGSAGSRRFPAPPLFVWGFAGLMLLRSLGLIPETLLPALATASQILLLGGVCAISAQVAPRDLLRIEPRLAWTLAAATAVIAVLAAVTSLTLVA
ncbi:YeiH family protein [Phenylobacterium sp. Root700]|uniref:YeiH family protein n=1 Tax=Phenylobacterium sp. Root700 TaxID=1736591 RepID=UPI001F3E8FAF|nr:putative sulfate exporter family transporter [Phenylobacterium sp. Root700]